MSARTAPTSKASLRLATSAGIGAVAGITAATMVPWQVAVLLAWDVVVVVFVLSTWWTTHELDAERTRALATRQDDSRLAADLILVLASLASLVGVGSLLLKAAASTGLTREAITALAIVSVAASWFAVHTVFTLRYAHLYYLEGGGIDFHGREKPSYVDFAYISFTIGMTFQVSDSEVNSTRIRATILRHALLSYVFGIAVIALIINVVAGMLRP